MTSRMYVCPSSVISEGPPTIRTNNNPKVSYSLSRVRENGRLLLLGSNPFIQFLSLSLTPSMAKKKGPAALRAKKRAREALEELQEQQAERATTLHVTEASNEELFMIDTSGDQVPSSQKPNIETSNKKVKVSRVDPVLVDKIKANKTAKELVQLAQTSKAKIPQTRGLLLKTHGIYKQEKRNFDLWDQPSNNTADNSSQIVVPKTASKVAAVKPGIGSALAGTAPAPVVYQNKPVRKLMDDHKTIIHVQPAQGGQSYHPDPLDYQKTIRKALALEQRREAAQAYKDTPISNGLSEETKAMMVRDSDDDDDSSDSENEGGIAIEDGPVGDMPKRGNKLTRAERNKQKRLKAAKVAREQMAKEKKMKAELSQIGKYKKDLKEEEKKREVKNQQAKKQETRTLGKDVEDFLSTVDPIEAPSLPVALQSELQACLRTVKPKGNLVQDRISSLLDRTKLIPKPNKQKQRRKKLSVKGRGYKDAVGNDWIVMG